MAVGRDNSIWIATENGLARYDKTRNAFQIFQHDENDISSLSGDDLAEVVASSQGDIWVIAWEQGLNHISPDGKVTRLPSQSPQSPKSDAVSSIGLDGNDNLWIGYSDGGVSMYDMATKTFVHDLAAVSYTHLTLPTINPV